MAGGTLQIFPTMDSCLYRDLLFRTLRYGVNESLPIKSPRPRISKSFHFNWCVLRYKDGWKDVLLLLIKDNGGNPTEMTNFL